MITHFPPAWYTRQSRTWKELIGKKGTILVVTTVYAAPEGCADSQPYQLAMIEFSDKSRRLLPVVSGETVEEHDSVVCVLRKLYSTNSNDVIEYGVKCRKVLQA